MLEDFLSKMGASTRITVGVSISPSVGLEMIEIDRTTGTVNKYSNKAIEYNASTREISDYTQFQSALEELFDELDIPKKSNIVLNIPNIHFGMINLPLLLPDEAITNAIISEVEQSYIFKRQEPLVSWSEVSSNLDTENRILIYSAIQKPAFEEITKIFEDLGSTIVGIENSYITLLRALHYTNAATDLMQENVNWNLMVINQNSYSILSMSNKRIVEYYEEPLALKSFEDNEIYNAIVSSAKLTLAGSPASYLMLVSETDLVSAEVLSMKMDIETNIKFLEFNKYTQNELLPINLDILPNMASKITAEAIGTAVSPFSDFPIKLNLVKDMEIGMGEDSYPRINIGATEVELTPNFIKRIVIIIGVIVVLPMFILSLVLGNVINPKEQAKLDAVNAKIQEVNNSINQYKNEEKNDTFSINDFTQKTLATNTTKLSYYSALGLSIPNKLWITYYYTDESGKIGILGKSSDVESIYIFYKNIKELVNNSDIRLNTLEFANQSIDDVVQNIAGIPKYYEFEISNMPGGVNGASGVTTTTNTEVPATPTTTNTSGSQKTTPGAPGPAGAPGIAGAPGAKTAPGQPGQAGKGSTGASKPSAPTVQASQKPFGFQLRPQPKSSEAIQTQGTSNNQSGTNNPALNNSKPTGQVPDGRIHSGEQLPTNLQKIEKF